ncbi:MAG: hypothetical protein LBQ50_09310 [Planctomycetaceae bacterium]|jgi:hypothetical protein|nr:hypothetical protein [Planctomycetaceae bacterium]
MSTNIRTNNILVEQRSVVLGEFYDFDPHYVTVEDLNEFFDDPPSLRELREYRLKVYEIQEKFGLTSEEWLHLPDTIARKFLSEKNSPHNPKDSFHVTDYYTRKTETDC